MAAAKASRGTKRGRTETIQFKSPAEFFAENQNIAGFDNVCVAFRRLCETLSKAFSLPLRSPAKRCTRRFASS